MTLINFKTKLLCAQFYTPGTVFPVSYICQDAAGHYEKKWDKDRDGEDTEDVNQHVRVTAFPEHCTQHFCRIIPEPGTMTS